MSLFGGFLPIFTEIKEIKYNHIFLSGAGEAIWLEEPVLWWKPPWNMLMPLSLLAVCEA